ncbi:MAG: 3-isopropylmalate dehydratase small subunit [Desulfobacterales bacterium]
MKTFGGEVLFLDRADINTDEIIPAKYLTENTKAALKPNLLEDLELKGFDHRRDLPGKRVIVARENFGCGSSREHAAWALEVNGIHLVVAPSFARIFRQNMFNCGLLAVELPADTIDHLFSAYAALTSSMTIDFDQAQLTLQAAGAKETVPFTISDFDRALIMAGGWLEYADGKY